MKINRLFRACRLFVLAAATCLFVSATALSAADNVALPFVSPMFGDNMVLQRGKPNTIWGWAKPGQEIRVTIADMTVKTVTSDNGRWSVQIEPPAPGGPYTVVIDGPQRVEIHDALVGDVWLCGGQSNMEMALGQARNGSEEIRAADHPNIRFFTVKQQVDYAPAAVPQGSWKICSPQNVTDGFGGFSAVAYFFGRRLQQDLGVPIGLVEDCVGGTPAESWTSEGDLRPLKDFDAAMDEVVRLRAKGGPQYGNFIMHWYDEYDAGLKGNWSQPDLDDADWKPVTIPGGFRELGVPETPALCYFRKSVVLPSPVPAGGARILLGVVERMETTYVNGRQVGASAWVENPRVYRIPADVLKPGTNVIAVRVLKIKPDGGFLSKAEDLHIVLGDKTSIPLAGTWKLPVKLAATPGAKVLAVKTGVVPLWSLSTTRLVSVTLPVFLTLPL